MMSHKRLIDDATNEYQDFNDLNLLDLWCATGNEWTSMIKKESLELAHQPLEAEKYRAIRGSVLLSVMVTVTLLGAATLTQVPLGSWTPQPNVKEISAN